VSRYPSISAVTYVGVEATAHRTHNGSTVTIPDDADAFMVITNPSSAPMLGAPQMKQFVEEARKYGAPACYIGRFLVYAFNDAWQSRGLVQELVTTLLDEQHQRIPSADPIPAAAMLRRKVRTWIRSLMEPEATAAVAPPSPSTAAAPAAATPPAIAQPAESPAETGLVAAAD